MSDMQDYKIRVILKSECGMWVAQGLEHDIAAQGKNITEAKRSFVRTFLGHVIIACKNKKPPFEGIKKAPKKYWDDFNKGEELAKPIEIPRNTRMRAISCEIPRQLEARVG